MENLKKKPLIPKQVHDYIYNNRGYFEGTLDIYDIDVASVCLELDTKDMIIYSGICIFDDEENEENNHIFSWDCKDNMLRIFFDGDFMQESNISYNLSFIDIEL